MKKNKEEITFIELYQELGNVQATLRKEICALLDITERTFFNKVKNNSFTSAEKVVISLHLETSVEVLFPKD